MGAVFATIELINDNDLAFARKGYIEEDAIKRLDVNIRVDTGSDMLCINESIQEQLQLPVVEKRKAILANGAIVEYDVVSSVVLRFKNRRTTCRAMILPADTKPILGRLPLWDLDVLIDPRRMELIVNPAHPYYSQMSLR